MSSGLSMASVNRIKEFAAAHEYGLAVEILDSQDLEKSLNPQFLAVCAEVYENVGRLREARQLYVKAHNMAPQSNRILFCLENFYLKLGYFGLAEKYLEQLQINSQSEQEKLQANYIMDKAKKVELTKLYEQLYPYYQDNLDETWSFELYLLSRLLKEHVVSDIVSHDYVAQFKSNHHIQDIRDIEAGEDPEKYFYIYADGEKPDADEEEKTLREEEAAQLIKDMRRLHPEQFTEEEKPVLPDLPDALITSEGEGTGEPIEKDGLEKGLKRFIKKKFKKKSKDEAEGEENAEEKAEETAEGNPSDENASESGGSDDKKSEDGSEKSADEAVNDADAKEKAGKAESAESADASEEKAEAQPEEPEVPDIVSVSFDDGFAPESDSIAELIEEENEREMKASFVFGKLAFDSRNAVKLAEKRQADEEKEELRAALEEEQRKGIELSDADVSAEEEYEAEVEIAEEAKPEPEIETEVEVETEPEEKVEAEPEAETENGVETESESENETEVEAEPEVEPEVEVEAEAESETEALAEAELESEPEKEEIPEPDEESEAEDAVEAEEVTEPEAEAVEEDAAEEVAETEATEVAETDEESEPEETAEPETESESEAMDEAEEPAVSVKEAPEVLDNYVEEDFLAEDEFGEEDEVDTEADNEEVTKSEKIILNLKAAMAGSLAEDEKVEPIEETEAPSGEEEYEPEYEEEIPETASEVESEPTDEAVAEEAVDEVEAVVEEEAEKAVEEETEAATAEVPETAADEEEYEPEYEEEISEPAPEVKPEPARDDPFKDLSAPPKFDIPEEKSFRKLSSDLFRTSNIPEHKQNRQSEELKERADQLTKNFDEEARKLKETEELLASLGIKL